MSWEPLNLAASEFAERPAAPAIAGLVYTGARHVVSGPPEAAKTLAALIFELEHIRAGGVGAIVDFEMGPTATRALLQDLGATLEEIGAVYYVEPTGPPEFADIDDLAKFGATLAIIDAAAGAYDASDLDDNKRQDAERFARTWIRPLWERGITTILLDHVVKAGAGRGRFAIGSERKIGQADVHLGLEPIKQLHRGADGLVRIRTHKDRRGFLDRPTAAELALTSDPLTYQISWEFRPSSTTDEPDGWRPTVLMQRISEYLERQADEVTVSAIYRDVRGKREYLAVSVSFLVTDGYATERPGNRGSRLIRSVKPYRDPSPTGSQSSPNGSEALVPAVPPPIGGDRDSLTDEVERLAARARDYGV